jgi:hypothetical protein
VQKFFQSFLGKHENPLSKVSGGSGQGVISSFSLAAIPLLTILPRKISYYPTRLPNSVAQALTV